MAVLSVGLQLDHLVISARTLAEGVAWVEDRLGLPMAPGGAHPAMGTHNRLLSLGEVYLEVIAIDPEAAAPGRARWFGLDGFTGEPRLTNWVARTADLQAALALAPEGTGTPIELSRGDLRWTMAVPASGILPFENAFPALIAWHGDAHPAGRLPDVQCRLAALQVASADPAGLRAALAAYGGGLEACVAGGPGPALAVTVSTPAGPRSLA